jgi:hypothetical protein
VALRRTGPWRTAWSGRGGGGIGPPDHWLDAGLPIRQTSLIVDPCRTDGYRRSPPALKSGGRRRAAAAACPANGAARRIPYDDLNIYLPLHHARAPRLGHPGHLQQRQRDRAGPGYVVFRNEMIHESRVIPLDGPTRTFVVHRMYMGDSRGHWDGDTLVVETTNLNDRVAIGSNGAGYPGDPAITAGAAGHRALPAHATTCCSIRRPSTIRRPGSSRGRCRFHGARHGSTSV